MHRCGIYGDPEFNRLIDEAMEAKVAAEPTDAKLKPSVSEPARHRHTAECYGQPPFTTTAPVCGRTEVEPVIAPQPTPEPDISELKPIQAYVRGLEDARNQCGCAEAAPQGVGKLSPEPSTDDESRCAICGWPLDATTEKGCARGNCSLRPRPENLYSPLRAEKESLFRPLRVHPDAVAHVHWDNPKGVEGAGQAARELKVWQFWDEYVRQTDIEEDNDRLRSWAVPFAEAWAERETIILRAELQQVQRQVKVLTMARSPREVERGNVINCVLQRAEKAEAENAELRSRLQELTRK